MCGITGWIDYRRPLRADDLDTERTLQAMTDTMTCRGPDAGGGWIGAHAAIGHRRLAVIDLDGGRQPMVRGRSPVVLSFSGEIYNFTELRRELTGHGHQFRTRSDTEVLLTAYLQWGADCVRRLNGMFAFAVWDQRTEELLLVRDRLGVKPLCYAEHAGGVVFGSEPKAVLAHPLVDAEQDAEHTARLFIQPGTHPPDSTLYRGIASVRPGELVRVGRGGLRRTTYWRLESRPHTDDLPTTVGTVRDLLDDIVSRQIVSDVPLGTLLSGGIDSSVITALAARTSRDQGRGKVASFSVAFSGARFTPELGRETEDEPFVRLAAEHIGTRHTTVPLDATELAGAAGPAMRAWDLPFTADTMDTSLYLMFEQVRRHCTVALSGESADEVFGGYHWYHHEPMLTAPTFPWAQGGPHLAGLLRADVRDRLRPAEQLADTYADAVAAVDPLPGETGRDRRIREVLRLGLTHWLPFLLDRKDRFSMAVGLEVRVPFCDHRLVEYVHNVPWSMTMTDGIEKGLLRDAAADLLPTPVLRRPKSMYPTAHDPAYDEQVRRRIRALLTRPDAPVLQLVDPALVAAQLDSGRPVGGTWAIPGPVGWAAYLLRIDEWLRAYRVRLV